MGYHSPDPTFYMLFQRKVSNRLFANCGSILKSWILEVFIIGACYTYMHRLLKRTQPSNQTHIPCVSLACMPSATLRLRICGWRRIHETTNETATHAHHPCFSNDRGIGVVQRERRCRLASFRAHHLPSLWDAKSLKIGRKMSPYTINIHKA